MNGHEIPLMFIQTSILMFRFWNTADIEKNHSFYIFKDIDTYVDLIFKGWITAFIPSMLLV